MAQSGRGLFSRLLGSIVTTEETDIKDFLQHSEAFSKMKEIAAMSNSGEQKLVNDIYNATTYADLLNTMPQIAQIPFIARPLFSIGGYVSQTLNFGYWAIQFRDAAVERMVRKGYSMQPSTRSYN